MKSSLRHQINHGHTWCRRYLMYWFLLSLLLSRVTLLFSLHSMGSSTITKWIRFIYAISFAKHANPFPLLQMMLVGPSRSEHYIAFQIRFCWKIQLPFSWSIPTKHVCTDHDLSYLYNGGVYRIALESMFIQDHSL